jgi:uncharacterized protein
MQTVGSVIAEISPGTKGSLRIAVALGADGGTLAIPVHVVSGAKAGPKLVVLSTAHGYEIQQISVLFELFRSLSPAELTGQLVLVPVANPVAFEMGSRCTWMDGLWGDSGNMNRLWPGRPNGWLTERFCHAIATQVVVGADAVIDLHASPSYRVISYGYLGSGSPGNLGYDISRVYGQPLLVRSTEPELVEKRQVTGTSRAWLAAEGIPSYSSETGVFYGLEDEREGVPRLKRGVPEVGVVGVTNVMKYLGMLEGKPELPARQVVVHPELNLRPSHGGLLISRMDVDAVGRVLPGGTELGVVLSPYSFQPLETITAPFERSLVLAATFAKPFTKVNPGDLAFIVADWDNSEVLE